MELPNAYQDFWWPFLLAKGRTVGPRMVLAPPFIIDRDLTGLLMDACALPEELHDRVARREVLGSSAGDFVIAYRVIRAKADLIDKANGGVLLDDSSRPVDLTEGMLCLGDNIDGIISRSLLDKMHLASEKAFRDFWKADDPYAAPVASQPLTEPAPASSPPIETEAVPSIDLRTVAKPAVSVNLPSNDLAPVRASGGKGCAAWLLLMVFTILVLTGIALVL